MHTSDASRLQGGQDKVKKIPTYVLLQVAPLWLIDPLEKTLAVFQLESARWVLHGDYAGNDKMRGEPFTKVEIELGILWLL